MPGFARNISDELICAVAAKGGVVMINFGSRFLIHAVHAYEGELNKAGQSFIEQRGLTREHPEVRAFVASYLREHPLPLARVEDVAEHIDHADREARLRERLPRVAAGRGPRRAVAREV